MTASPCWSAQFPCSAVIYFLSVCINAICRQGYMPLSDMARVGVPRKRSARRRRASHRLREIIGTRPHLCELFGHAGFDMRIGGAGAARRRQRELARYALRMVERRFRVRIVVESRRVRDVEKFDGR